MLIQSLCVDRSHTSHSKMIRRCSQWYSQVKSPMWRDIAVWQTIIGPSHFLPWSLALRTLMFMSFSFERRRLYSQLAPQMSVLSWNPMLMIQYLPRRLPQLVPHVPQRHLTISNHVSVFLSSIYLPWLINISRHQEARRRKLGTTETSFWRFPRL